MFLFPRHSQHRVNNNNIRVVESWLDLVSKLVHTKLPNHFFAVSNIGFKQTSLRLVDLMNTVISLYMMSTFLLIHSYYGFPNNRACSIKFFAFFPRMFDLIRNSRLLIFEDRPTIKAKKKN